MRIPPSLQSTTRLYRTPMSTLYAVDIKVEQPILQHDREKNRFVCVPLFDPLES